MFADSYTFTDYWAGTDKNDITDYNGSVMMIFNIFFSIQSVLPVCGMKISVHNHTARTNIHMVAYRYAFMALNDGICHAWIFSNSQRCTICHSDFTSIAAIYSSINPWTCDEAIANRYFAAFLQIQVRQSIKSAFGGIKSDIVKKQII